MAVCLSALKYIYSVGNAYSNKMRKLFAHHLFKSDWTFIILELKDSDEIFLDSEIILMKR
jgi:hypothetical protein